MGSGGCALVARPAPPSAGAPGGGVVPGPGGVPGAAPEAVVPGWREEGIASWYGVPFHGRQTASGEVYDMEAPTAAHRTLPFGALVEVLNLETGSSTRLRINDRGPFVDGRVIDVSRRGARELGLLGPGIAPVRVTVLEAPTPPRCWEVQVGAYRERVNAEAALTRVRDRGAPARIVEGPDGLLRVRAGPWNDRAPAEAFLGRDGGVLLGC